MPEYIPLTFGLEALYPPMSIPGAQLRDIYMKLADSCRFPEFQQLGQNQGGRMAEGNNRYLTIGSDRFVFRDEYTRTVFPTYIENTNQILDAMKSTLRIPVLLHCKVLIRSLMPAANTQNTVEFFQQHILNNTMPVGESFSRPASALGLRMVFPPTNEHRSSFTLRIEPYIQDTKMFFLENTAQFFDPMPNFKDVEDRLNHAHNFVKEQAGPFLERFS